MKARIAKAVAGAFALWLLYCGNLSAREMTVVFLNPGEYQRDAGWTQRSLFMQAAAEQFGVRLEVQYSDRDRLRMVEQAKAVAARQQPPDYVVLVNETEEAVQMLEAFRGQPTRVLFMHNDLTQEQRTRMGNERERMPNWIGSIVTDERVGGHALMAALARRANGEPKVLGLGGVEATPVSGEREEGMRNHLIQARRGEVLQVVPGNWTREDAREKAQWLLARYPDANVFWVANDTMALGALDAILQAGRRNRMVVGGIGGFTAALDSVASGGLDASVAGNGFIGAWVIVLLHDYHHGHDFAQTGSARRVAGTVAVATDVKSARRLKRLIDAPGQIDFRRFSRAENPSQRDYDFSYDAVLAAVR